MNKQKDLALLLIDDNSGDRYLLREMLASTSLAIRTIHEASTLAAAKAILSSTPPDIILLDLSLPDSTGIEGYFALNAIYDKAPFIILTGMGNAETGINALHEGVQDFLTKDELSPAVLEKSIRYSIERKLNAEQVRLSDAKYRLLFDRNPFPSIIIDNQNFRILEVNKAAVAVYGYSREEFALLTLPDIRVTDDARTLEQATWEEGSDSVTEKLILHRKRNGDMMTVEATFFSVDFMGRPALQMQVHDVTARLRLEDILRNERIRKRRAVSAAVLEAQEKERKLIGQEIHDNVNQILTAARLYADMVLTQAADLCYLKKVIELVTAAIQENRKLSKNLILPQLRGEGLLVSLEELRLDYMMTSSLKIKFFIHGVKEEDFTEPEKVSLYRIVQEQLNNIIKYAEAYTVLIRIYKENNEIILSIKDNGKGFDPAVKSKGVGIVNMSNRAAVLRGNLLIDSAPGKGCTLQVVMQRA